MSEIPPQIDLDALPGPRRGSYPALYFRDDIVWSPSGRYFALAYTIAETSMCNDVGCILWGEKIEDDIRIICNPRELHLSCWQVPFCRWLTDEIFVCKVQRPCLGRVAVPLLLIDIRGSYWVVPNTNLADQWLDTVDSRGADFRPWDEKRLLAEIQEAEQDGAGQPATRSESK